MEGEEEEKVIRGKRFKEEKKSRQYEADRDGEGGNRQKERRFCRRGEKMSLSLARGTIIQIVFFISFTTFSAQLFLYPIYMLSATKQDMGFIGGVSNMIQRFVG